MLVQNHCKSRDWISTKPLKTWPRAEHFLPFWITLLLGHAVHIGNCRRLCHTWHRWSHRQTVKATQEEAAEGLNHVKICLRGILTEQQHYQNISSWHCKLTKSKECSPIQEQSSLKNPNRTKLVLPHSLQKDVLRIWWNYTSYQLPSVNTDFKIPVRSGFSLWWFTLLWHLAGRARVKCLLLFSLKTILCLNCWKKWFYFKTRLGRQML